MTNTVIGGTLITSKIVETTISYLRSPEKCSTIGDSNLDECIADTVVLAKTGSAQHMAILGRWHLFGEQPSVEVDVKLGFELVKEAHEMNNIEATAYYGHCLIRGLGVEKNKTDGYELLVDATGEGSGAGKDFAAYTLGFCYRYDVVSIKIAQTETMN
jgi:hypothetical protein